MADPVLEFFSADWIILPPNIGSVQLRIIAAPPVVAGVGIVYFIQAIPTATNPQPPWSQVPLQGKPVIDNIPQTPAGSTFDLPLKRGFQFVLRFQGQSHLLVPGFQTIKVGFDLSHAQGSVTNFDGSRSVDNVRAAAINGQTFYRQP